MFSGVALEAISGDIGYNDKQMGYRCAIFPLPSASLPLLGVLLEFRRAALGEFVASARKVKGQQKHMETDSADGLTTPSS